MEQTRVCRLISNEYWGECAGGREEVQALPVRGGLDAHGPRSPVSIKPVHTYSLPANLRCKINYRAIDIGPLKCTGSFPDTISGIMT
jgi:hypothetical protein